MLTDMVFFTPWGCLTLDELRDLARQANQRGDFDQRDEIEHWVDKCHAIYMTSWRKGDYPSRR